MLIPTLPGTLSSKAERLRQYSKSVPLAATDGDGSVSLKAERMGASFVL
jgi:hypothetical protein